MAVSDGDRDVLAARFEAVRARIAAAAARARRPPGAVRLLAVSKGHPARAIRELYALGQREFGENYAQELVRKAAELEDLEELRFRFIGRFQRNKAKALIACRCSVDSVDSFELGQALAAAAERDGRAVEIMVQVNIDREPQKAGALPEAVPELAGSLSALPSLQVAGLMAIPRATDDPAATRAAFAALSALASSCGLEQVSMGMSGDLELAIEAGATMVRIGTAIFGPRPTSRA